MQKKWHRAKTISRKNIIAVDKKGSREASRPVLIEIEKKNKKYNQYLCSVIKSGDAKAQLRTTHCIPFFTYFMFVNCYFK